MGLFSIFGKKEKKRKRKRTMMSWKGLKSGNSLKISEMKKTNFAAPLWKLVKKMKTITEDTQMESVSRYTFSQLMSLAVSDPLFIAGMHRYQTSLHEMITLERFNFNDEAFEKKFAKEIWPTNKSHFQHCFIEKSPYHLGIYGNTLTEMIKSKDGEHILDCQVMNIRQYDFYDEGDGMVKTEGGYPVGFVDDTDGFPEDIAEKKDDSRQPYYISDVEVVHSPFIQFHNTEWAYGFAELMYTKMERMESIEEAQEQQDKRQGWPIPLLFYGDSEYRPSIGMKKEAMQIVQELADPETVGMAIPKYDALKYMDDLMSSDTSQNLKDNVMALIEQYAGIMGIPIAALMMSMKDQPATGFSQISEFYEYNVKDMAKKLRMEKALQLWSGNPDLEVVIDYDEILAATTKEQIMNIHRLGKANMLPINNKILQKKLLQKLGFKDIGEFSTVAEDVLAEKKKIDEIKARGGGGEE